MADQDARNGEDKRPTEIPALRWEEPPEGPVLVLLDQTRLPAEEVERVCTDAPALVAAIRSLAVRGAPLLGIAGAYGVALAAVRGFDVDEAADSLARSVGPWAPIVRSLRGAVTLSRQPRPRWPPRGRCTGRTQRPARGWRCT